MSKHRVDHVFMGHIHACSTVTHDAVDYTITGGGGGKLAMEYGPLGSLRHYVPVEVKGQEVRQEVARLYPRGRVPSTAPAGGM